MENALSSISSTTKCKKKKKKVQSERKPQYTPQLRGILSTWQSVDYDSHKRQTLGQSTSLGNWAINITKTDNWTVAAGGWAEVRAVWCQGIMFLSAKERRFQGKMSGTTAE